MWESIISIIVKYWIEFLLGSIVAGGGLFFRRYINLSRAERDQKRHDSQEKLKAAIREDNQRMVNEVSALSQKEDAKLQKQIDTITQEVSVVKLGISSVQKKDFLEECHRLLDPHHIITLEEWEDITEYHDVYNALGGNSKGDQLFKLIKIKVEQSILPPEQ